MKRQNLHFSLIFIFIIIVIVYILFANWLLFKPTKPSVEETKEIIVYEAPADWSTVKRSELQPQTLDKDIQGHFIDTDTTSCFFIAMKMLGYNVDIDQFYWDMLEQKDSTEIPKEGKITPEWIYNFSMSYIASKQWPISAQKIGDKGFTYLCQCAENNYPIITWIGDNWYEGDCYIIYKADLESLYLINSNSRLSIKKEVFKELWEKCGSYAFIYGKYW